jgi:hypothetical protein
VVVLQEEFFRTDLVCRASVDVVLARVSVNHLRFPSRLSNYVAAGPEFDAKKGRADIQVRSSRRHAGLDARRRLQSDARSRAAE